jgi:hypothetical protein
MNWIGCVATSGRPRVGLVRHPDIRTDDRFDPAAARSGIELDQAEEVAEISQRQRRHTISRGPRHGIIDTDDAVGDGVFAMQAKVNEVGNRS